MTQIYEATARCVDDGQLIGIGCAPSAADAVGNAFRSIRATRYAGGEYSVELSLGDGTFDWMDRKLGADVIGKLDWGCLR